MTIEQNVARLMKLGCSDVRIAHRLIRYLPPEPPPQRRTKPMTRSRKRLRKFDNITAAEARALWLYAPASAKFERDGLHGYHSAAAMCVDGCTGGAPEAPAPRGAASPQLIAKVAHTSVNRAVESILVSRGTRPWE